VVNTLSPVLFFSSAGIVYKLKVYRLPLGAPQARGKAMVYMLPAQANEIITTMWPCRGETSWASCPSCWPPLRPRAAQQALGFRRRARQRQVAMKMDEGDRW